jgi:hypothetical protein
MAIWSVLWQFGPYIFGHLVYFMIIWYIFHILVCCTWKNLATLAETENIFYLHSKNHNPVSKP